MAASGFQGRAVEDPAGGDAGEAARLWWLLLLGGAVSLVIGILLLVWPSRTLEVLAILLGIELLLVGAIQIGLALGETADRTGPVLLGALACIAGLIVIRHPGGSLTLIALAVGIYLVLAGVLRLVSAFEAISGRGWLIVGALFDIAIGVLIVAWPKFGITSFAVLVGIAMLLRGTLDCISAFALRSLNKQAQAGPAAA